MTDPDLPRIHAPLTAPPPDDERTAPYWEGFRHHEVRLPRCETCERYHWYPRGRCPHCRAATITWTAVSGRGTVYTWVRVAHHFELPFLEDAVPYDAGLVVPSEADHVRLPALLAVPDGTSPTIGMAVESTFDRSNPKLPAPVYTPP